jgi:hypothetical protein
MFLILQKQRGITFHCTISSANEFTVVCIKFTDRAFTKDKSAPEINFNKICIFEEAFDVIFNAEDASEGIDKEINDMVCNRQDCLILGRNQLQSHQLTGAR